MKLLTFQCRLKRNASPRIGLLWPGGSIIDLVAAADALTLRSVPTEMVEFLDGGALTRETIREVVARAEEFGDRVTNFVLTPGEVRILSPLPRPRSIRIFNAFPGQQHLLAALAGNEPVPAGHQELSFFFASHQALHGDGDTVPLPSCGRELDIGSGLACIIGRAGVNIEAREAHKYIAGFTIINDWTLRDVQKEEGRLGFGFSKSKDFATSLGPYLVDVEDLADRFKEGRLHLEMTAKVNGETVCRAHSSTMQWSFFDMIERASRDAPLFPGDVLASGECDDGSLAPVHSKLGRYLVPGDVVELEVEELGLLANTVG